MGERSPESHRSRQAFVIVNPLGWANGGDGDLMTSEFTQNGEEIRSFERWLDSAELYIFVLKTVNLQQSLGPASSIWQRTRVCWMAIDPTMDTTAESCSE